VLAVIRRCRSFVLSVLVFFAFLFTVSWVRSRICGRASIPTASAPGWCTSRSPAFSIWSPGSTGCILGLHTLVELRRALHDDLHNRFLVRRGVLRLALEHRRLDTHDIYKPFIAQYLSAHHDARDSHPNTTYGHAL
jgi:hypothetical protein